MDGIIDQEIMDEINAEQAGSEAAAERADALSEDTGAEGGATGAEAGAPGADEAGELPELSPMPGDDAGGGAAGAFRARDEPEKVGDAGAAAGVKDAGNAGSAQGEDVSPRIRDMARQAQYIRERTGVDMLEVLKADSEIMQGVSDFNAGRGGFDMMGAYNAYRVKANAAKSRARVPATSGMAGGQTGSGRTRVEDMTDADIEKIEERVRRGERVIL